MSARERAGQDWHDDPRLTTMGLFYEAFHGVDALVRERFAAHDISLTDFEILLRLVRSPNRRLRMADLAAQTSLTTSGVTRVVDRLENTGMVSREMCETDRRGTWARASAAGAAKVDAIMPGHLEDVDRWLVGLLTPSQRHAFEESLRVLRDAVRPDAVAGAEGA